MLREWPESDARSVPESDTRSVPESDARSVPESDARSVDSQLKPVLNCANICSQTLRAFGE